MTTKIATFPFVCRSRSSGTYSTRFPQHGLPVRQSFRRGSPSNTVLPGGENHHEASFSLYEPSRCLCCSIRSASPTARAAERSAEEPRQPPSRATIAGKTITINYNSPGVKGRAGTSHQGWADQHEPRLPGVARRRQCGYQVATPRRIS